MKLSLTWIFEHIKNNFIQNDFISNFDIDDLVKSFNETCAEVKDYYKFDINLDLFTVVKALEINKSEDNNTIKVYSAEHDENYILPYRSDIELNKLYIVKKISNLYKFKISWATLEDLGSEKEGLISAITCKKDDISGKWKSNVVSQDYIIDIDNKSITNRPDLWSHRGIAREIAAILNMTLIDEKAFLGVKEIKTFDNLSNNKDNKASLSDNSLNITNNAVSACDRFAALEINDIDNNPSDIELLFRLSRVNIRSINTIVDLTNYVMVDIGQPMHAFDKSKIDNNLIIRFANPQESLMLLDKEVIELSDKDLVIADKDSILALAGIMGGLESAVDKDTNSLLIESAHFNPSVIRSSSTRLKKRTDASIRFEKNIDPNQNTRAILRFLYLLDYYNVKYKAGDYILLLKDNSRKDSSKDNYKNNIIDISQEFIESRLGLKLSQEIIKQKLESIGFKVDIINQDEKVIYQVKVPSYRASKDITVKEDILEEIARFIGYNNIPHVLPKKQMKPFSIDNIQKTRALENHLAFACNMHQIYSYSFFDEQFISEISYNIINNIDTNKYSKLETLKVLSPVSENWYQLVTTLVLKLIKAVIVNKNHSSNLNFFEIGRKYIREINNIDNIDKVYEQKTVSGIFYEKNSKSDIDFYAYKNKLNSLFNLLNIEISWPKLDISLIKEEHKDLFFDKNLYHRYKTAMLIYDNKLIGYAGIIDPELLTKSDLEGNAFIFELNLDILLNIIPADKEFKELPKYQQSLLDISILVDQSKTVKEIKETILSSNKFITQVNLVDIYINPEWEDKKSLTFRFVVYNPESTLTKQEIDNVVISVKDNLISQGAQVR